MCLHRMPSFLFTSLTSSALHFSSTSSQHRVYILPHILFTFSISQCQPTLIRHCVYIVCLLPVHIVDIVGIAMLIDIKSTPCLHCTCTSFPVFLFKIVDMSTLQCRQKSSRHCVYIVCLLSSIHRRLTLQF